MIFDGLAMISNLNAYNCLTIVRNDYLYFFSNLVSNDVVGSWLIIIVDVW